MQDEVRSAEGQPGAELLQKALGTFLDDIRASLGNGTLQCSEQAVTASAGLERQQKLRAELETQKAVLTARLERFLEVHKSPLSGSSSMSIVLQCSARLS